MIWDYIEEFLKRYYKEEESNERVPKFANFYKNYLKFFCVPTFKDIFCNEMIHNYSEKKAELFYNENYRSKKEKNSFQEDMEYLKKVNQMRKVILQMLIIISKKQYLMRQLKKKLKNIPR